MAHLAKQKVPMQQQFHKFASCIDQIIPISCICTVADVTLEDFANANRNLNGVLRLKKGTINSQQNHIRALKGSNSGLGTMGDNSKVKEVSWYDKDLDEFEISESDSGNGKPEGDVEVPDNRRGARNACNFEFTCSRR